MWNGRALKVPSNIHSGASLGTLVNVDTALALRGWLRRTWLVGLLSWRTSRHRHRGRAEAGCIAASGTRCTEQIHWIAVFALVGGDWAWSRRWRWHCSDDSAGGFFAVLVCGWLFGVECLQALAGEVEGVR